MGGSSSPQPETSDLPGVIDCPPQGLHLGSDPPLHHHVILKSIKSDILLDWSHFLIAAIHRSLRSCSTSLTLFLSLSDDKYWLSLFWSHRVCEECVWASNNLLLELTAHSVHSCLAANFTQPTTHPHMSWYQRERERDGEKKHLSGSEIWLALSEALCIMIFNDSSCNNDILLSFLPFSSYTQKPCKVHTPLMLYNIYKVYEY